MEAFDRPASDRVGQTPGPNREIPRNTAKYWGQKLRKARFTSPRREPLRSSSGRFSERRQKIGIEAREKSGSLDGNAYKIKLCGEYNSLTQRIVCRLFESVRIFKKISSLLNDLSRKTFLINAAGAPADTRVS